MRNNFYNIYNDIAAYTWLIVVIHVMEINRLKYICDGFNRISLITRKFVWITFSRNKKNGEDDDVMMMEFDDGCWLRY